MSLYNIDRYPQRRRLGPLAKAQRDVQEQERWIADHGATLAGYIARYGPAEAPKAGTLGGPAVFAADLVALHHLQEARDRIARRARQ